MCVSALPSVLSKYRAWPVLWQDSEGERCWSIQAPRLTQHRAGDNCLGH